MPTPDSDPSVTLEAIKERAKRARTEPAITRDWARGKSADDVPSLVAALEAVLKAHRPSTTDGRCCWCRDADGQRSAWPCGEYLAITAALNRDTDG